MPIARNKDGTSKTQFYDNIAAGLMTHGVKIGSRAVAWPEHEVDAIVRARIAGKTDDEIRALVRRLEADRQRAADDDTAVVPASEAPKAVRPAAPIALVVSQGQGAPA